MGLGSHSITRGGGKPGLRNDPTSIEASGTRNNTLIKVADIYQTMLILDFGSWTLDWRSPSSLNPIGFRFRPAFLALLICCLAPTAGGPVLREDDDRRDAIERINHRRVLAEVEGLKGVEVD